MEASPSHALPQENPTSSSANTSETIDNNNNKNTDDQNKHKNSVLSDSPKRVFASLTHVSQVREAIADSNEFSESTKDDYVVFNYKVLNSS